MITIDDVWRRIDAWLIERTNDGWVDMVPGQRADLFRQWRDVYESCGTDSELLIGVLIGLLREVWGDIRVEISDAYIEISVFEFGDGPDGPGHHWSMIAEGDSIAMTLGEAVASSSVQMNGPARVHAECVRLGECKRGYSGPMPGCEGVCLLSYPNVGRYRSGG